MNLIVTTIFVHQGQYQLSSDLAIVQSAEHLTNLHLVGEHLVSKIVMINKTLGNILPNNILAYRTLPPLEL